VIEPSAAVQVAAVLGSGIAAGRRAGVILSGGNLDHDRLSWQEGLQRPFSKSGPGARA
jgi:threonine dehydratase